MTWEHAAEDERGTMGREMYELERQAIELGPEGASLLSEIDQFAAYYREQQSVRLFE